MPQAQKDELKPCRYCGSTSGLHPVDAITCGKFTHSTSTPALTAEAVGKVRALRDRAERQMDAAQSRDDYTAETSWRSMRDAYEQCLTLLTASDEKEKL